MNELAIASVPLQEWEQPYEVEKALRCGNIFPALQKPFFIEEQMTPPDFAPKDDCERKLLQIQQIAFFITDLTLFLDTHPGHRDAEDRKQQLIREKKQLTESFALEYYPLTIECPGNQDRMPVPWGGGDVCVAL